MSIFDHLRMTDVEALPAPQELLTELAISGQQKQFVQKARGEIRDILDGSDSRHLLIVGPCSIHDIQAARDYAAKLKQLSATVSDTFCILMRVYFEKPRTALGWKGLLYDPWLNGSDDLATGLRWARQFLLELAEMGVPVASEFLEPSTPYYLGDLVAWSCIGARTVSSQIHRQMASGLPMATAFKNSTDGTVDSAVNGILSASQSHTFMGMNPKGHPSVMRTQGNAYGHLVLRGGETQPNYDPQAISMALDTMRKANLAPRLLIDCSHDNSMRKHEQQVTVFQSAINQIIEGNRNIRGMLIESHLNEGNQPLVNDTTKLKYAVSLTDPCLNWDTTERLILWGHSIIKRERETLRENEVASVLVRRVST
ncbi:MAG: 3-deoxy-7-phosphoheptulonate synthase [Parachlamydiaceae bacterium]|nr:3-deoxy-7-phosphoheptulonate synthase [Parachlamydiaceae bacterium]